MRLLMKKMVYEHDTKDYQIFVVENVDTGDTLVVTRYGKKLTHGTVKSELFAKGSGSVSRAAARKFVSETERKRIKNGYERNAAIPMAELDVPAGDDQSLKALNKVNDFLEQYSGSVPNDRIMTLFMGESREEAITALTGESSIEETSSGENYEGTNWGTW